MDNSTPKLPRAEQQKQALQEARTSLRAARKILKDIEGFAPLFNELRASLTNKDEGAAALLRRARSNELSVSEALIQANAKLKSLEAAADSVDKAVSKVENGYAKFQGQSAQVFDKDNGLAAVLAATRKLRKRTIALEAQVVSDADSSKKKLADITKTVELVAAAYGEFLIEKAKVDDEKTGLAAQLRRAEQYANDIQAVKTNAESALVSVTNFSDRSKKLVEEIELSKTEVSGYKKESDLLTADLKNTLNKATQYTLSQAIQKRRFALTIQLIIWGIFQVLAIIGLVAAVGTVFYFLFVDEKTATVITSTSNGVDVLLTVISKFLFTTPLIFAVYFTTSNFAHVRDLRDRYSWKETVAKNFQNYIVLLNREFDASKYEQDRFDFSMETIRSIYSEPNPQPKKRKINFGINRIIKVGLEEEDINDIKRAVVSSVSSKAQAAVEEGMRDIEEAIQDEMAIDEAKPAETPVDASSKIREVKLKKSKGSVAGSSQVEP